MGMNCGGFRVATNRNDILWRFFETGEYRQGEVHPSHAPSMDIQAASNFERYLYYLLEGDQERVRQLMRRLKEGQHLTLPRTPTGLRASRMDDADIVATIARVWNQYGYVVDPHTACAFTDLAPDRVSVILSTASPAKFPEVVAQATGSEPRHPTLEALKPAALKRHPLPASAEAIKAFITSRL
jgi:threonine synthase